MKKYIFTLFLVGLLSGCERDDTPAATASTAVADSVANEFIRFFSAQEGLPADEYNIVISTQSAGESGSYTLTIEYDTGVTETRSGSWVNSSGPGTTCTPIARPCETLTLQEAGGIKLTLTSTVPNTLDLRYRNGSAVCDTSVSRICTATSGSTSTLTVLNSQISGEEYGNAYYAKVDPNNERATLAAFKSKNGFGSGTGVEVEAVFRDVKDLGYGRKMTARKNTDGTLAFFVENYLVQLVAGSNVNYGPLNLDAAINATDRFHVGTNAIEFSPITDGGSEYIVKFYTFSPGVTDEGSVRRLSLDMDGRGDKSVPGMCFSCHGGRAFPVGKDGLFQDISLNSAKLNLLEQSSFEFSDQLGYRLVDQQDAIRTINDFVLSSYPETINIGDWDSSFAREVALGRYNGDRANGSYNENFIPAGWKDGVAWQSDPSTKNPTGTELLFKQVVEPHCYSCHSLQGTAQQGAALTSSGVNFSSYEKFKRFESEIVEYVYRRGNMPLSLRNYERFWLSPGGAPTLLASHLGTAFDIKDSSGKLLVQEPGLPYARAGNDVTVKSPVQLNGSGSLHAATYQWRVVSAPTGATTSFSSANSAYTNFTASQNGVYVLSLSVSNAKGSNIDQVQITINNGLIKGQDELSFATDIKPILQAATTGCTSCHADTSAGSIYPQIPVMFTDNKSNINSVSLYADVLSRVDLREPENSPLLRKPLGINHVGGARPGFASTSDFNYQTILNWIRAGAQP